MTYDKGRGDKKLVKYRDRLVFHVFFGLPIRVVGVTSVSSNASLRAIK